MNIEKRCNHYTLIVACMLSGASQDRPVIVGWSTAPRDQVIQESLGQVPKKLAAGPRVLARTESSRTQSGTRPGGPPHDHWAKLGQLRYTRSQYAFVVMHFSRWNSSRRPSRKKGEPVRSNGLISRGDQRCPRAYSGACGFAAMGWCVLVCQTVYPCLDHSRLALLNQYSLTAVR